ncbi:unnamed protein product [Miscanthus lutarioriparius]|uniref:No apical meristem-associated C-terminal domain-containing protein n=1 Tax=Miscanthus lutarioriparius TaxID=422564 RepID=A0A811PUK4_9POAL|nr:unnamed protein product [Miscanthus lutarioriparius]
MMIFFFQASAWLNTSKDPIYGNDKSRDTFWGQISNEFNRNIQEHLQRDINQLKIHWTRLNRMITEFNGFFSSVSKVNKSGYSDDMLMDEAQQMYKKKYGKRFALEHWWKKLKKEPKWCASAAQLEKEKSKTVDVDATDDGEEARPIGREAAKAQRKGKRKVEEVKDGISMLADSINKIAEITQERKKEREKVTEAQLEISRNNLQTAIQQNEAKLLEAYTSLLVQDTSQMTHEAKEGRIKALALTERKLFGNQQEAT